MVRIKMTGWKVGLDTVRAIKEIRERTGCPLGEALAAVNKILDDQEVIVEAPDQENADQLLDSLAVLGIRAGIVAEKPIKLGSVANS